MFPRHTTDPWGRHVLLTEQEWEHIETHHPDLKRLQREVLAAVVHPDVITPDLIDGRWHYWVASVGISRWLFVVVDWNVRPPIIVTAFAKRKDPI